MLLIRDSGSSLRTHSHIGGMDCNCIVYIRRPPRYMVTSRICFWAVIVAPLWGCHGPSWMWVDTYTTKYPFLVERSMNLPLILFLLQLFLLNKHRVWPCVSITMTRLSCSIFILNNKIKLVYLPEKRGNIQDNKSAK